MNNKKHISIHQSLHGYKQGHVLLSSSKYLSSDSYHIMDIFSDLSGNAIQRGFNEYITGYPIIEEKEYAFAKTWYATTIKRSGAVWTHTLLIRFSDMHRITDFRTLKKHFKNPELNIPYSDYEKKIYITNEENNCSYSLKSRYSETETKQLLYALYGNDHKRPVYIISNNSFRYEDLILSIWSQQPVCIKKTFFFCTGTLSNRKFNNRSFDVQVIPPFFKERIKNDETKGVFLESNSNLLNHDYEWLDLLCDDILYKSNHKLRRYINKYEINNYDSNINTLHRTVQIFISLNSITKEKNPIPKLIQYIAQSHSSKNKVSEYYKYITEIIQNENLFNIDNYLLLKTFITTSYHELFDPDIIEIRNLAIKQIQNNIQKYIELMHLIKPTKINKLQKEYIKVLLDYIVNQNKPDFNVKKEWSNDFILKLVQFINIVKDNEIVNIQIIDYYKIIIKLVKFYIKIDILNKNEQNEITHKLFDLIIHCFPEPNEGMQIKEHFFGKNGGTLKNIFNVDLSEERLLYELALTQDFESFSCIDLSLKKRTETFCESDKGKCHNLIINILDNIKDITPFTEQILIGTLDYINIKNLEIYYIKNETIFDKFLKVNPTLIQLLLNESNIKSKTSNFYRKLEKSAEKYIFEKIKQKDIQKANDIYILYGKDRFFEILMKSDKIERLTWFAEIVNPDDNHIFKFIKELEPNSKYLSDYGNDLWHRLSQKSFDSKNKELFFEVMTFLLSLGLYNTVYESYKLVQASFQHVYDAAKGNKLTKKQLENIKKHFPSRKYFNIPLGKGDCDYLRAMIIEKFIEYDWPGSYFLSTIKEDDVFIKILKGSKTRKTKDQLYFFIKLAEDLRNRKYDINKFSKNQVRILLRESRLLKLNTY